MLPDNLYDIVTDNLAIILSLLSLVISIVALWFSLQRLKIAKERLRVAEKRLIAAEESLHLQKQQFSFGKDFAKGRTITDGSLRLDFLPLTFTGPEDDGNRLLARLMQQSIVETPITIENNSSSDALVQNLYVIPRFRFSARGQSWFVKYILHTKPHDSEVYISLKEHEIHSIIGPVGEEWLEIASSFDYFQGRYLWHAIVYDTSTDEQILFTEPITIPHDGCKRTWELKLGIDPEFYQELLKRRFFLSGINLLMITDLGRLEASCVYDTPGMLL